MGHYYVMPGVCHSCLRVKAERVVEAALAWVAAEGECGLFCGHSPEGHRLRESIKEYSRRA